MFEKSISIQVDASQGELMIKKLRKLRLLNNRLKIKKNNNQLLIPLIHKPSWEELATLKVPNCDFQILNETFIPKKNQAKTLDELLEKKIPEFLFEKLPHSLDIIGDIAIIEIPEELKTYSKPLGEAILELHKNVKTVLSKSSPIQGAYRLRSLNFLSGENRTYTTHLEYGCKYFLDIAKVYFSPRLSQEHNRVASLTIPDEVIVDLFAGVGPFSILIAKKNPTAKIYSIDINPSAIEFLEKNIKLNRVDANIKPFLGDAKSIVNQHLLCKADRVIMNLPEKAKDFIKVACKAIRPKGGIIHYYEFIKPPDTINEAKFRLSEKFKECERIIDQFLFAKKIKETAPYQNQVAFDIKIH